MNKKLDLLTVVFIMALLTFLAALVYTKGFGTHIERIYEDEALCGTNGKKSGAFIDIRRDSPLFEYGPAPVYMDEYVIYISTNREMMSSARDTITANIFRRTGLPFFQSV